MSSSNQLVRPPTRAATEHLFCPSVWIKPVGDEWVIEVDWSESYRYSFDNATDETIEDTDKVGPDLDTADLVLNQLLERGMLPKGDNVTSLPWVDFDPDPMEYFA